MADNDKKGNTPYFFLENKLGKRKQEMQEIGNKHAIGGPNHMVMEHSFLSRCNHKAGLDGPMAYCVTWHTGPNSRSQIITRGYDGIH